MKREDQILQILTNNERPMTAKDIALACSSTPANIQSAINSLVDKGLGERMAGDKGLVYSATDAGKAKAAAPEFGQDSGRMMPPPKTVAASLSMGVFTTGELHIEANGKRIVLSKSQAGELIDFVCSLPNKLFSNGEAPRPRSAIASMVHRCADDDNT